MLHARSRQGRQKRLLGELLPRRRRQLRAGPSRWQTDNLPGLGQAHARIYFSSEGRLYQTAVFGSEKFVMSDEVTQFLDSFKIVERKSYFSIGFFC